jgi:uncharacterized protein (DUF3084 family)
VNDSLSGVLISALVALATGGSGAAAVTGFISHRKTRADVDKTVAETGKTEAEILGVGATAAATQVETSLKLLQAMWSEMSVMRTEVNSARDEARAAREECAAARRELTSLQQWRTVHESRLGEVLDEHEAWDREMIAAARSRGESPGRCRRCALS